MTNPPTLERGALPAGAIFGNYRIRRLLGHGGMGTVYEAEHAADGRVVALKVLSADVGLIDARERFLREGRSAAAVNHPNTVYVYGTEEIDGRLAISMELVADGTLEQRVDARGPLPVDEVVGYAEQLIDGLAAAYDVGLLHRDVKPSNCFVAADGTLKVGDFGLSKPIDADEQLRLTQSGTFLGTPLFSSPEQLLGETLDVRSDIYAVGLTLYYALTGRLPYASGSMAQVIATVLNGAPTPITAYRADLPAAVAEVVMKAMARTPEARFQSYDALRAAVVRLRAPEVVPAPAVHRLRAWIVDGAVVWLVTLGAYVVLLTLRWPEPAPVIAQSLINLCVALSLVAVPEGLRGASLGKWLLGIQVQRSDGRLPGLARACARAVLLWGCLAIADVVHRHWGREAALYLFWIIDVAPWLPGRSAAWYAVAVLARLALLTTARRENGWRTVHDRLTGTRVVRLVAAPRAARRQASAHPARPGRPAQDAVAARVGPYQLIANGDACDGCALGWDAALQRHVWITTRDADDDAVSDARRAVARVTRLRWLGSGRVGAARWDAYGAPSGEPFARRVERPIRWEVLRRWVEALSDELAAAERDGTLPVVPSVDALWVDANDGLLVVDTAAPSALPRGATGSARDLMAAMIARARQSAQPTAPLPLFAARALDEAASAPDPRSARAAIAPTAGRPVELSRRQRTWLLGVQLVPSLLAALIVAMAVRRDVAADWAGVQLFTLLEFVEREGPKHAQSAASLDSLVRERRLAAVYIATTLAGRARDTTSRSDVLRRFHAISKDERARALQLERELSSADTAEVRAARFLVDSVWHGVPTPYATMGRIGIFVIVTIATSIIGGLTLGGTIAVAVLLRRGVLLRVFDIELVTRDGRPAGRLRVVARQCAVCLPLLLSLYIVSDTMLNLNGILLSRDTLLSNLDGRVLIVFGVPLLWSLWVWHAIRSPSRSVADRLAGTYLVPG